MEELITFDERLKQEFLLSDQRIQLRCLRVEDVHEDYLEWMRNPEVTRYSQWRFFTHSLDSLAAYAWNAWNDPNVLFCSIRLVDSERHIGNIKLTLQLNDRIAEISVLIGATDCWGKGYATAAIRMLSDYALKVLALRKVYAGAYSSNIGSIRAFEKAGFKIEARFQRHFLTSEGEVDGVYFARFAEPKGS